MIVRDMMKKLMMVLMAGLFAGALVACEEQGPAEEVGEAVDDAAEETGEAVEDAADSAEDATSN